MAASEAQVSGVVIADVVGSSQFEGLRRRRDKALAELSRRHLAKRHVLGRYTVTAWDEFQNVLSAPWELPRVVWDLRLAFHPMELRIGVGLGAVDELPGPETPINEVSSGEAFRLAREAVAVLEEGSRKYRLRTLVRSGDRQLERAVNLIYMLADSLLAELSERQWETLRVYEQTGRQDRTAERLGLKSESTVSRNLQRAHYWQLLDARDELRELLWSRFAPEAANP